MRKILTLSFLLISSSAFAQNSFTFQELVDIYLTDRVNAIQIVESKGFAKTNLFQMQEITGEPYTDQALYSRKDNSMIGLVFNKNKVFEVIFTDSTLILEKLLPEIQKDEFELVHQYGNTIKVYVKKGVKYFVSYSVLVKSQRKPLYVSQKKQGILKSFVTPE
jgi:hypothetical protein